MTSRTIYDQQIVRVNTSSFQIPTLPPLQDLYLDKWQWRDTNQVLSAARKMLGVHYGQFAIHSFDPRHFSTQQALDRFIWIEYELGQASLAVNIGRFEECDLYNTHPQKVTLVPRGWALIVLALARSRIIAFNGRGQALDADGDWGMLSHPCFEKYSMSA